MGKQAALLQPMRVLLRLPRCLMLGLFSVELWRTVLLRGDYHLPSRCFNARLSPTTFSLFL